MVKVFLLSEREMRFSLSFRCEGLPILFGLIQVYYSHCVCGFSAGSLFCDARLGDRSSLAMMRELAPRL